VTEASYVEEPVLTWLGGSQEAGGLGWTYRDGEEMAAFDRPLEDPLVESLLIDAVIRINESVTTSQEAAAAVAALRTALAQPDRLTANRETMDLLRDGAAVVLRPGEAATTVRFIALGAGTQHLNDFTVTNQYRVQGVRQCRDDTVLLVNGIPLVVAEYKSYITSGHDWREAVRQLHRYQRQAPLMLASNVFCVAADEEEFRFGTVMFHDASNDDIDKHLDSWTPWRSLYPEQKGYWNDPGADDSDDALEIAVRGLLRLSPCHILDYLENFTVFETRKGRVVKKVARYQQFEAANEIVDRTVALIDAAVPPQDRTGLIWHTQGSGKSLTMIFAAYKLRHHVALGNPTVLIVVDRRDLKTQLGDDFDACDYPSVEKALGVSDLKTRLAQDWRGTLITTIQSFQNMGDLTAISRTNVISLIDEAHRTQGAGKESFATVMRAKIADGYRFGFTGTPIDRTMQNTHRDFGPRHDGQQERYLSYYGIRRSIKDGATLEVHYQRQAVPFSVDRESLDLEFEELCEEMEVEDEASKDLVQRQRARWLELVTHPERVEIVTGRLLDHFLSHPDPNGFKAQLVVVDRKACAQYKRALDEKLVARGLPAGWAEVIISSAQNSDADVEPFEYQRREQDEIIERFRMTAAEWEATNREQYGPEQAAWPAPVKILIVCDRLLAGFDAPIEQVMYLDKPLRDHNLLQAIARTNRPMPSLGKSTGVVVDFFGVLNNLEKALNFDESIIEEALIDWDVLRRSVAGVLTRVLAHFSGISVDDSRDSLLAALRRLRDPEVARTFETDFRGLQRLWEAIAPDPILYGHGHAYKWLCGIFVAHRRRKRGPQVTYGELSAKTRALIEENVTFMTVAESLPTLRIGGDWDGGLAELPSSADKAAALEAALTAELSEDEAGFTYQQLGDRLQRLRTRRALQDEADEQRLKELKDIADAVSTAKEEPATLGLTEQGQYELFSVLRAFSSAEEADAAEAARAMIEHLHRNNLLAPGWSNTRGGRMRVEGSLLAESWNPRYAALGFDVDDPSPAFLGAALTELIKSDRT
jgi:type I restriction enzyme R subunit